MARVYAKSQVEYMGSMAKGIYVSGTDANSRGTVRADRFIELIASPTECTGLYNRLIGVSTRFKRPGVAQLGSDLCSTVRQRLASGNGQENQVRTFL
jgi:hypothetical protein